MNYTLSGLPLFAFWHPFRLSNIASSGNITGKIWMKIWNSLVLQILGTQMIPFLAQKTALEKKSCYSAGIRWYWWSFAHKFSKWFRVCFPKLNDVTFAELWNQLKNFLINSSPWWRAHNVQLKPTTNSDSNLEHDLTEIQ